jgi:hydroxymethylglutaryl-CoA reductase
MTVSPTSRHPGFYALSVEERLERIEASRNLTQEARDALMGRGGLDLPQADQMIENVIGLFQMPLGVAVNFIVNGREVLIPMAIEEPSVVAGASNMAKLARAGGGFTAQADSSDMIGQIQVLDVPDLAAAERELEVHRAELLQEANAPNPTLVSLGGGAKDLQVRILDHTPVGPMLVVHLIVDVVDAMGANAVNTAVEAISDAVERWTGGRALLRILSNLADQRIARASCRIPVSTLSAPGFSGQQVRDGIIEAWAFAAADPYRATTHNKGIMNGIDALLIATGNDWRAAEAGAHAYAARSGSYSPLSTWSRDQDGGLRGELHLPLAVGAVGGATQAHPTARASLELMGIATARELAEIAVSLGLAQNLAALRALATEGIQRGHMALHARQVAMAAGAEGDAVQQVAQRMIAEGSIGVERARMLLKEKESG